MRKMTTPWPLSILALVVPLLVIAAPAVADKEDDSVFLWSSTGGGWRAMVACTGFANLFGRAGLLPLPTETRTEEDKKYFDAISTTSGASWFSTQFFFSPNYYTHTMTDRLMAPLIEDWMTAYKDIGLEIEADDLKCLLPSDLPKWKNSEFEKLLQLCDAMMHYKNEWAAFVTAMLAHSASKGYQDDQYATLQATPDNRVPFLKDHNIKLLLHTTLVPQTRSFKKELLGLIDEDLVNNLGPANDDAVKYAGVLPVTYSVDSDNNPGAGVFTIGSGTPLQVHQEKTKRLFHEDDWKDYGLFPLEAQDTYLISKGSDAESLGALNTTFFNGAPLTTQVASISSAAAGGLSPSAPSVFAQVISHEKHFFKGEILDEAAMDIAIQGLYDSDTVKGTAVCSQWPSLPCGDTDGRFADGAYSDNPAFVQNVAHYQQSENADLTKTLKIVLTNTNQQATTRQDVVSGAMEFVKYWKNPFNENIDPGTGYLWTINNPYGSPQIFAEELTIDDFVNVTIPIPNSNVTTQFLQGTTIDNELWGTKAGQPVQILLISINSPIPIMIVGSSEAQDYTQPLMDMATELATSNVLLERVQSFFSTDQSNVDFDEGTDEAEDEILIGEVTPEPLESGAAVAATTLISVVALMASAVAWSWF